MNMSGTRTIVTGGMGVLLSLAAVAARAETVVLRDGTTRQGTIEKKDLVELHLRLAGDGISAKMVIPLADVVRIEPDPEPSVATTPPVARAAPAPLARAADAPPATAPSAAATTRPATAFAGRGFFAEMASSLVGQGPDAPDRLPADVRKLWDAAMQVDAQGKRADTLDALRALEEEVHGVPGGVERLEGVSRRVREEGFGAWMARVHWDVLAAGYKLGQFDLGDVRDVERPLLIGMLRQKTEPALEPLRSYFPPIDQKTGNPQPFKPAQLQGIGAGNAIEVKEKAAYASAVLRAQLKLEPDMPGVDRQLIAGQLAAVNRILSKAVSLEPAARMAQQKAERDRKMAEDRARREASAQRVRNPLGN
jgi:hypothetical protein